jgi:hypothetical protein
MTLPISTLLSATRNRGMSGSVAGKIGAEEGRARFRSRLRDRVNIDPTNVFPYLILLEGFGPRGDAETVADELDLVEKALQLKVGTVLHVALRNLHWMYRAVHDAGELQMQRVREILEHLDFNNPWLQSEVVELLSYYEIIDSPVSLETAKAQFRAIADPTPEEIVSHRGMAELAGETPLHFRQGLAYQCIGSIFEDFYQNVYYEAYTSLTAAHKRTVLSMGALQNTYGFHSDWILHELLELRSPDLLPTPSRRSHRLSITNQAFRKAPWQRSSLQFTDVPTTARAQLPISETALRSMMLGGLSAQNCSLVFATTMEGDVGTHPSGCGIVYKVTPDSPQGLHCISWRGAEGDWVIHERCMWILRCSARETYLGLLTIALRTGDDSSISFGTGTMIR